MKMKKISFDEVFDAIKQKDFPEVDFVVAIGRGGVVPGAMVANLLGKDFEVLWLNLRDEDNEVVRDKPELGKEIDFDYEGKKILIVDDVSRSGSTLLEAKKILKGAEVTTFVLNGKADIHLFDKDECFMWPWKV